MTAEEGSSETAEETSEKVDGEGEAEELQVESSPAIARVSGEGEVSLPEELVESLGWKEGDRLVAVPDGCVVELAELELPTVGEYGEWVEERAKELGISQDEVEDLMQKLLAGE